MSFPDNFVWGAAAASYQIEGAAFEECKGLSVWDDFAHRSGKVWRGHNGDVACDHYHRYKEDVALMKQLGLQAYRLSVSWPRVLPTGVDEVNTLGLDFYDRLIDELMNADITPYVTLFHWDFPYDLYCKGGWANPDSSDWFADYTSIVVRKLGDRVKNWITLNEPAVFVHLGHFAGEHAPGDKFGQRTVLRIVHNALLSHGKAVMAIRAASPTECRVGAAPDCAPGIPASENAADIETARRAMFHLSAQSFWGPALYVDPMVLGEYPAIAWEVYGADMPDVKQGDMATIKQPLDFLGVNIYQGVRFRAGENGQPEFIDQPEEFPRTLFGWPVTPEALYWGPRFLHERYDLPIIITENGMSNVDWVSLDGKVHDPQRIDYLTRYLRSLRRACADGVPVQGYFHWSILDNFEWAEGYKQRFGMVYVNYETLERIPKDSAYWYRDVIQSNGVNL